MCSVVPLFFLNQMHGEVSNRRKGWEWNTVGRGGKALVVDIFPYEKIGLKCAGDWCKLDVLFAGTWVEKGGERGVEGVSKEYGLTSSRILTYKSRIKGQIVCASKS